ncbi:MAG TPA: LPS export ABC transporter permease LptG, partial [Thermoanaerobaculia bacterium]|nr:LPS export ABC transporter permease LptG [Thermoanaerobaculia bacterium]
LAPTFLGLLFYTSIILMRQLFEMTGMIIRRSLPVSAVVKLLLWSLPHIIVLTVPMSLLFGILIAVGRLSADSEVIAMRALGISTRTIYRPVFLFSLIVFGLNLYLMNFVLPRGNARLQSLRAEIFTSSVEKEIKPRVFYDEYENLMIYVNDVDPRTGQWKGVFVADSRTDESHDATTPQQLSNMTGVEGNNVGALGARGGQRIIIAEGGSLAIQKQTKQVWLNLHDAQTHLWDPRKPDRYDLNTNQSQRILLPDKFSPSVAPGQLARSFREMTFRELLAQDRALQNTSDFVSRNMARVEIHKKLAIPFACIVFGVLGLPLGITNRRGGKSSGFSLSIAVIVFYYVGLNNGEQLATSGKIPPVVGMWGPNVLLLAIGIYLLIRANRDVGAHRAEGGLIKRTIAAIKTRLTHRAPVEADDEDAPSVLNRLDITFPNILDRYILREFLKVLGMVLISAIALFTILDYTDLAKDIRANNISASTLLTYYRFQIFYILHWTLPISVLVSTLVAFGILAKNNEITAIKSGGVSLYRTALPIVVVAGVIALLAYFMLDFVLPYSSQRSDRLRRQIEGRPSVAAQSQQKLWFLGKGRYVINFLAYDRATKTLSQVQVFEFHPTSFHLARRVYAQRARWDGKTWVFENGWVKSFPDKGPSTFTPIVTPIALQYSETPEDFATEVKAPDQMTFAQLRRYVETIRSAGYAAEELSVKLYTKTSWPAISVVMVLIALPFAFKIGKRGALYGFGIALVLGIVYWMVFAIFSKFGEVGNLPPLIAAWSANILFAIAALYMFLHVET